MNEQATPKLKYLIQSVRSTIMKGSPMRYFRAFLIYVASSGRPPHELIRPSLSELEDAFVKEFEGMTIEPVSLVERKDARAGLQMTFEPDSIRTRYDQWRPRSSALRQQ